MGPQREAPYTFKIIDPKQWDPKRGFRDRVKRTRGTFAGWTKPMGLAKVPHAIFRLKSGEWLVPIYDLTPETKARIGEPPNDNGNASNV